MEFSVAKKNQPRDLWHLLSDSIAVLSYRWINKKLKLPIEEKIRILRAFNALHAVSAGDELGEERW